MDINYAEFANAVPARAEGDDRMAFLFVIDRNDPEGPDPELDGAAVAALGADMVEGLAAWAGISTDAITCVTTSVNTETDADGPHAVTGTELIELANPEG